MGHVVLHRAGHDMMNRLVRKILESPDRYRHIELGAGLPNHFDSQSQWMND